MADPRSDARLRLTVLGGYLGSGKTTWLRHQLHDGAFAGCHVIVNEAAEIPVDHALLRGAAALTVLAGGCACCTGRAALIAALRGICDAATRAGAARPAGIVLETSGLADPAAIVAGVQADPVLVSHILVAETVVLVDALHAVAQLATEPLGRRQIAAADRLVLTKTDAADPAALARLRAMLGMLNPGCVATAADRGVPVGLPPLPLDIMAAPLPDLPDDAGRAPVIAARVAIDTDWPAFAVWLSALLHARGDELVRVKGVVRTPAGRLLVQAVRRAVQSPEILADAGGPDDDTVVFIGRGFRESDLQRSLQHFAGRC